MGMIDQEMRELRKLHIALANKTMSIAEVNSHIGIYSQSEKRIGHIIKVHLAGAKSDNAGKKYLSRLTSMQLIGDGSVIDYDTDIESETVKCPDTDKIITRLQCKEYSEKTGNLGTCSTCDNFQTTRKLLGSVQKEIA